MAQKILIIEDDRFLRKVIAKKLSREKYQIIEAIDGEEGLRLAQLENPDLILLDLVLPQIDGFEVLERIKNNENISKIPVIILSNLGGEDKASKGLKMGAADFLVKSELNPGEIVDKIKAVFEKSKKIKK
ncbi:MAG: response regulator [bacterium]|nr:response regulator [bacterium]